MEQTRSARLEMTRGRRRRIAVVAAVVVAIVVAVVITGIALAQAARPKPAPVAAKPTPSAVPSSSAASTVTAGMVEVPELIGREVDEATVMLTAAGFNIVVRADVTTSAVKPGTIVGQEPEAGAVVDAGSDVVVHTAVAPAPAKKAPAKSGSGYVVVIDPGHQARGDSRKEPIGPGASTQKPAVAGGATGVSTHVPEYEVALQISMNLKKQLESQGVKVIMTRTTNDVNLSNSQRAEIANRAKADLFVRIHADSSTDSKISGISTLYPGANQWTKPIVAPSKRAAADVHSAVIASTGAVDRGIKPRTDLTGFNWSEVPTVLVECGFLSNPVEDRLLSSPHYQDKLAAGITAGVMKYLGGSR